MVPMTTNTLTTEQRREALTFRNHLLWDANLLFRFRLTNNKFTNLKTKLACLNSQDFVLKLAYLKFGIGNGASGNSGITSTLQFLV